MMERKICLRTTFYWCILMLAQAFLVVRGSLKNTAMKYQKQQHLQPILRKQVSYTLLEINGKAQLFNTILIAFYSDS